MGETEKEATARIYAQNVSPAARGKQPPICSQCQELVICVGINNPARPDDAHFRHYPRPDTENSLDDCLLASRNARLKKLAPYGRNKDEAEYTKKCFLEDGPLGDAFAFFGLMAGFDTLVKLSGSGGKQGAETPNAQNFSEVIRRMDQHRIWEFAGLQPYMIPFVAVALADFEYVDDHGVAWPFHFAFRAMPRRKMLTGPAPDRPKIWHLPEAFQLRQIWPKGPGPYRPGMSRCRVTEDDFWRIRRSWHGPSAAFVASVRRRV